MSFEDFNFTNRTRCPHCRTSLLIIDNKIDICPLCEIESGIKAQKDEKETPFLVLLPKITLYELPLNLKRLKYIINKED